MNDEDMINAMKENYPKIIWQSILLFLAFPIINPDVPIKVLSMNFLLFIYLDFCFSR